MATTYPLIELTRDQKDALKGTQGTPSGANKFVTSEDPRLIPPTYAHGIQPGGNLHSLATQTTPGFLSAEDKKKIDEHLTAGSGSISNAIYKSRVAIVQAGTAPVLYESMTTVITEPGEFRYAWNYEQEVLSNNTSLTVQVYIDGVLESQTALAAFQSAGVQIGSGFRYIPSAISRTHTIEIYFYKTGGGTANIRRVDLEFWKKV